MVTGAKRGGPEADGHAVLGESFYAAPMTRKRRSHGEDLRGASRLVVEATKGITGVVKEMHRTIGGGPAVLGKPLEGPTRLVTGLVYGAIQGVMSLVGAGIDGVLEQLSPIFGESRPGPEREALRAAINGVLGDHLDETDNPLRIEMALCQGGHPLDLDGQALATTLPEATGKLLVMVHGLCMNDRQWCRAGHDHGAALAQDFGLSPVYLHYNSGRHISTNGRDFAVLLDQLVAAWPTRLDEIIIVGHSMGGLVTRSACHAAEKAGLGWREKLGAIVFIGTPHHGAPLERGGNLLDVVLAISRYSLPLAQLGKIRSAGVTDLRFGNVLDEHWDGRDRFEGGGDLRTALPLPAGVACYAIAGTTDSELAEALSGDGLVPVDSALGRHATPGRSLTIPEAHQWTGLGIAHLDLLARAEVYETLRGWLSSR
jgi:pimeloyl-ACP methyl ester carboxylesterase